MVSVVDGQYQKVRVTLLAVEGMVIVWYGRIAVGLGAGAGAQLRAVSSAVLLDGRDERQVDAARRPVAQGAGFESTVLDQLAGGAVNRQGDGRTLDD